MQQFSMCVPILESLMFHSSLVLVGHRFLRFFDISNIKKGAFFKKYFLHKED